jgi:hypothetical protein
MAKKAARKKQPRAHTTAPPRNLRTEGAGESREVSKQTLGGVSGAVVGGMVAGPVGAIIGGVAGALVGDASAKGKKPVKRAAAAVQAQLSGVGKKKAVAKTAKKSAGKKTSAAADKKSAKKSATKAAKKSVSKSAASKKSGATKKKW